MVIIDSLNEVASALSDDTIADPLRLTVQPQYRTIGITIEPLIMTLEGHPRSMIFTLFESQHVTSY